jgi:hypothetical protein
MSVLAALKKLAPWRGDVEQGGDVGDGFAAGFDLAYGGAGVAVPGLGHDQLEGFLAPALPARRLGGI